MVDNEQGPPITESAGPNTSPAAQIEENHSGDGVGAGGSTELAARVRRLEQRLKLMMIGFAILTVLAIGLPLIVLVQLTGNEPAPDPVPAIAKFADFHPEHIVPRGLTQPSSALPLDGSAPATDTLPSSAAPAATVPASQPSVTAPAAGK